MNKYDIPVIDIITFKRSSPNDNIPKEVEEMMQKMQENTGISNNYKSISKKTGQ